MNSPEFNGEQWKSGGNCSICRRKEYCKKRCNAFHGSINREIFNSVKAHIVSSLTDIANKNGFEEENL